MRKRSLGKGRVSVFDDDDIETKRIEERRMREERELRHAKHENVMWGETFKEAVEIMTEVIQYPSKYIKDPSDERTVLLEMIRQITNLASNPEDTEKYKLLEEQLRKTEGKLRLAEQELDKKSIPAETVNTEEHTTDQEKHDLSQRLDRLETFLVDQISDQRRFLNKQSPSKRPKP